LDKTRAGINACAPIARSALSIIVGRRGSPNVL
jgi:hypothetical protein